MCQCASPTVIGSFRTHLSGMFGEFGKGFRHVHLKVEVTFANTSPGIHCIPAV